MPQLSGKPRTLGCLHEFLRCLCCAAHVTSLSGFCGLFQLIGMLCINFDDSRYRNLSNQILGLCHPDMFVTDVLPLNMTGGDAPLPGRAMPERFPNTTDAVAVDAINRELEHMGVTADRLTSEERLKIIAALESNGIFLMKGAVKDVAAGLHCSQASVYRYLSQVKSDTAETT